MGQPSVRLYPLRSRTLGFYLVPVMPPTSLRLTLAPRPGRPSKARSATREVVEVGSAAACRNTADRQPVSTGC